MAVASIVLSGPNETGIFRARLFTKGKWDNACICARRLDFFVAHSAQAADLEAGKRLATTVCAACHGATEIGVSDTVPNLAVQRARHLEAQLKFFKDGIGKEPGAVSRAKQNQACSALAAVPDAIEPAQRHGVIDLTDRLGAEPDSRCSRYRRPSRSIVEACPWPAPRGRAEPASR
jgi:cytochrome c553